MKERKSTIFMLLTILNSVFNQDKFQLIDLKILLNKNFYIL